MQTMNKFDRLENLAQRLIEGAFNRLFRAETEHGSSPAALPPGESPGDHVTETREVLSLNLPNAAARWRLQLVERQFELGEPVIAIGRAPDNDIILGDPTVSRYHAQLRWREGRYHLCPPAPAGGDNGQGATRGTGLRQPHTTVNHRAVAETPLSPGDIIRLGHTVLKVIVESGNSWPSDAGG